MANDITQHLATIISARYGEQVRQAIHDAIQSCYTDGQWNVTAGQSGHGLVDLLAREQINKILNRSTNNVQETLLWQDDNSGGAWYEGQSLSFSNCTNPTTEFNYIYVYYKPVVTADPELRIFKASDFRTRPNVISGVYFAYDNEEFETGPFATMRKMVIRPNPSTSDTKEFIIDGVRGWRVYSDNGTLKQSITNVDSSMTNNHAAGTISMITGVKYASVEDAVSGVMPIITGGANGYMSITLPNGNSYTVPTDTITNKIPEITETSDYIQIEATDAGSPVEMHAALYSSVGDLGDLDTSDGSSVVNAINEVNDKIDNIQVASVQNGILVL